MFKEEHYLIKNVMKKHFERDFTINPHMSIIFIVAVSLSLVLYRTNSGRLTLEELILFLCFPFILTMIFIFAGRWEAIVKLSFLTVFILLYWKGPVSLYYSIPCSIGAIMAPFIQVAKEWERAVILRFGKFKKVKGPGLYFLIPFIDSVSTVVDMRIRVTDFVAETTLTRDSVPVTVDALAFWLVWDAEKAILEVENYIDAVVMSSQTALREAISQNDLSTLLENSEEIREAIRKRVDAKTSEWGLTIQHIEITEIKLPEPLQELLSKTAQAEREKKARILLGEAEVELAKMFDEAGKYYQNNDAAVKLRTMNIIHEGLKSGNSMILPSSLLEKLDVSALGLKAIDEIGKIKKDREN